MSSITTSALVPYKTPGDSLTNKTSLLVPWQLPEFVRDNPNFANYVAFIEAYYEWMEQQGNTLFLSKGIPEYKDIDSTLDQFIKYYLNDFLSFFPQGSLINERNLIKISKELYQAKGTPAAFKFLFRVLYNSDVDLYNARDYIFRASDGQWITTRSLKLNTLDTSWLKTINYRVFGETSKAYAEIEDVIVTDTNVKVILSNIQGNFLSGEFVSPVDIHSKAIVIDGQTPTARVIGFVSAVKVDKINYGNLYSVGDPVVFHGGTDPEIDNPVEASGYISKVSAATLKGMTPTEPGHGYRKGSFTQVNLNSAVGVGAKSIVTTLDKHSYFPFLIPNDTIGPKANTRLNVSNYDFANLVNANANTTLIETFTFPIVKTYGIEEVDVVTTGTGYDGTTIADAVGLYSSDQYQPRAFFNLGILSPVHIVNGGKNYVMGDKIEFVGGSGYGAWALVTNIDVQFGGITEITYISDPSGNTNYPLGGMGYNFGLPTVKAISKTGQGAKLEVRGLYGHDAEFNITSSPYGQVQEITLTNPGENYVSTPLVSLRVQDFLLNYPGTVPKKGDLIFQGDYKNPTFYANVDSTTVYTNDVSKLNLRVYNYDGIFNSNNKIILRRGEAVLDSNLSIAQANTGIYTNGRKIYGNGTAEAKAVFTNGITLDSGIYGNQDGQPSAYSVLKNEIYNEFTYLLQVEKALAVYKNDVLAFLHPSGLHYSTYNILKNDVSYKQTVAKEQFKSVKLGKLLNTDKYTGGIAPNRANTIIFNNLNGANVAAVIPANSYINIYTKYGDCFTSLITSSTYNSITFAEDMPIIVPSVAEAYVAAGSSTININRLTSAWRVSTGNNATYFSDFMHNYDYVSFDGSLYKMITHVDQPQYINEDIITPRSIRVDSAFSSTQAGYITFKQNVNTNNVWISSSVI